MKIKAGGKFVIIAAIVAAVGYYVNKAGYLDAKPIQSASVPMKIDLPSGPSQKMTSVGASQVNLQPASSSCTVRVLTIPWNATAAMHYANGDAVTAPGSLMAKRGVTMKIERQDDYAQIASELAAFAKAVNEGEACPSKGAAMGVVMGNGYPSWRAGVEDTLGKLGHKIKVVTAIGYSRGEDKCMMPPEVASDPQRARGILIAGVKMDGDPQICMKWAGDNDIPVNVDDRTYDPNAINFAYFKDVTEAANQFVNPKGICQSRKNIKTGKNQEVCATGAATWTPGDVTIATKRGGVVSIASTGGQEYIYMMPSTLFGVDKWMQANRELVENIIAAIHEGGEAILNDERALLKAAEVQAKVYKEEDARYWAKYFRGVPESDKRGNRVQLGGSTANGLGDAAFLFGLNGNDNLYKKIYTLFGTMDNRYYPDDMPGLIAYEQAVDSSYLEGVLRKSSKVADAVKPVFTQNTKVTGTFASKSYSIEFETGKASFTPQASRTLDGLLNEIAVTGLRVQINGHTDSTGNSDANFALSKARADAVKNFILRNASGSFNDARVVSRGYGDTQPVADNRTNEGRAKNRRVDVVLQRTN